MKNRSSTIMTACFLIFILGFQALFLLQDRGKTSYYENRSLAAFPVVSAETITSGEFMEGISAYVTDHFPFRDFWVKSYLTLQMSTGQTFIYEYLVQENGWIFAKPITYSPRESMDQSISSVAGLAAYTEDYDIDLFFVSLPSRRNLLPIDYPDYLKDADMEINNKEYLLNGIAESGVDIIDIGAEWLGENRPQDLFTYYWRTDHHWNMEGAFYGYRVIRQQLADRFFIGTPVNEAQYERYCAEGVRFVGAYNKQLYELIDDSDPICYYRNIELTDTNFTYYLGSETSGSLVAQEAVYGQAAAQGVKKADYGAAYAGDLRELTIVNEAKQQEQTRTLVVKDSYVNSLLPLIAEMSHVTTFYDIRYNSDRSLKDMLESRHFDRILIMYNDLNIFEAMYRFGFLGQKEI